MKKFIYYGFCILILTNCATAFLPGKQKITIITGNPNSTVYVGDEEFGKGATVTDKVKKGTAQQVVIKTPGYKDNYSVLFPSGRSIGYYILQIPNIPLLYGLMIDPINPKNFSYDKIQNLEVKNEYNTKKATDKFIDISKIKLDIKDKDADLKSIEVIYTRTALDANIKDAEFKLGIKDAKAASKKKKKKGASLVNDDNKINYENTTFTDNVYKSLKSSGFVDTINTIFSDQNNTLVLEGVIKKANVYTINGSRYRSYLREYYKAKVFTTWYIKNTFNEILDSIETSDLSGDFAFGDYVRYSLTEEKKDELFKKMYRDAVDISYLNLHNNPEFLKYMGHETNFSTTDPLLSLNAPKSIIKDKSDASTASVIVKTKDGHGSGFAITNDGYILTNYHVIAGRLFGKINSIKVITSDGSELEGTVVRYNKFRDIALIKVNKTFEKAFKLTNQKLFKSLQDVYTIGAPKSVELGQSISVGVISNERKSNNNNLLQLGMSINSGNSGGPLFDSTGLLHGVIVAKLIGENTEGVGFAIPSYLIQDYININYK